MTKELKNRYQAKRELFRPFWLPCERLSVQRVC